MERMKFLEAINDKMDTFSQANCTKALQQESKISVLEARLYEIQQLKDDVIMQTAQFVKEQNLKMDALTELEISVQSLVKANMKKLNDFADAHNKETKIGA